MITTAKVPSNRTLDDARDLFHEFFNGQRNLMTPGVIRYGWKGKGHYAYEISQGDDFLNNKMFGVTILEVDSDADTITRSDFSQHCKSLSHAESVVAELTVEAWRADHS